MSSLIETKTTTCGSLLQELQKIWDEIGESDIERDKMLLQLEQECLDVYRRKVESTCKYKVHLHQALAEAETEITNLVSVLGEQASFPRSEKAKGKTLNEKISVVKPILDGLWKKRDERIKEFRNVKSQIVKLHAEMEGNVQPCDSDDMHEVEQDLTLKKLGELMSQLEELQREKSLRLEKVNAHVNSIYDLAVVLSIDFTKTMNEVHPSMCGSTTNQSKNISNDTLAKLAGIVHSLKQEKIQRLKMIQVLGSTLIELWNLLDTPMLEQKRFDHITCLISASVDEVSKKGCLALDVIEQTEHELGRLNVIKASKMKELVLKKQNELEEIYRGVHMDVDTDMQQKILINHIDSGNVDLSALLSGMDEQINKAKEQALSRKEILDKVEKWKFACEEESWLDDYERDQNRFSAGRGAHKNLKRAEKARILVSKIPSLLENLTVKVRSWEDERGILFFYDKVPLLETLQRYTMMREEREEDKRRSREKKRLQEQLATEQEALFGSRPSPSPSRPPTLKKPLGQSNNANTMTPGRNALHTPLGRHGLSAGKERKDSSKAVIPENFVALPKG
ncbi:hypothetical protein AQUCO_00900082v1 [Aquilegia coerulea]|uniref:Uncharacterized protein n=1 Tax=Aquilegia coerulea TaxID=218851 RepID=A0A2G5EBZ6_AQUCA|nr:hypothetical protein AQUCO_00900082v1 [Aquilegia coerulea]